MIVRFRFRACPNLLIALSIWAQEGAKGAIRSSVLLSIGSPQGFAKRISSKPWLSSTNLLPRCSIVLLWPVKKCERETRRAIYFFDKHSIMLDLKGNQPLYSFQNVIRCPLLAVFGRPSLTGTFVFRLTLYAFCFDCLFILFSHNRRLRGSKHLESKG